MNGPIYTDSDGKVRLRSVRAKAANPSLEDVHTHTMLNRWTSTSYGAIRSAKLHSILRAAERGEVDRWVDLSRYMLRTEPVLRALYQTRILAVAGAELEVNPGRARPGQENLAKEGADFYRESLDRVPDAERMFADLLDAVGVGWSGYEHQWCREDGAWYSYPTWIHPRDIQFSDSWGMQVRDTNHGQTSFGKWIDMSDHPDKFIVHVPRPIADWPQLSGELMGLAWKWLFMRWIEKFRMSGLERFSNPLLVAMMESGADSEAIKDALASLEKLSATHAAVIKSASDLKTIESSRGAGSDATAAMQDLRMEIAVALHGSDLNSMVGSTGGNRSLGESQFSTAVLPRYMTDSLRLGGTMSRDHGEPSMRFNTHLFGGMQPATPVVTWKLLQEDNVPPVNAMAAEVATVDEVRTGDGLDEIGPEQGGDEIVQAPAPAPAFSAEATGDGPTVPLADSPEKSGATSSRSPTTVLASALSNLSVDLRPSLPARPHKRPPSHVTGSTKSGRPYARRATSNQPGASSRSGPIAQTKTPA